MTVLHNYTINDRYAIQMNSYSSAMDSHLVWSDSFLTAQKEEGVAFTPLKEMKKKLKHEEGPLQFLLSDEQSAFFVKENDFSALAFNYFNLFIFLILLPPKKPHFLPCPKWY